MSQQLCSSAFLGAASFSANDPGDCSAIVREGAWHLMRLTRQTALIVALVCAGLAAILGWIWRTQRQQATSDALQTVEVRVPVQTIPAQTQLQPAMFKTAVLAPASVPPNAIVTDNGYAGCISLTELPADQPVRSDQVATRSAKLGLAYSLRPNQRAISVSADLIEAVGDFVQPGNHVDVLVAWTKNGHYQVRTLVQDILVLAVGQATSPPPLTEASTPNTGAGADKPTSDRGTPSRRPEIPYTLAVTPDQAQAILLADISGNIRFTLRPADDRGMPRLTPTNSWDVISAFPEGSRSATQPPAPPPPAPAPVPPANYGPQQSTQANGTAHVPGERSVEIIRGSEREVVMPE